MSRARSKDMVGPRSSRRQRLEADLQWYRDMTSKAFHAWQAWCARTSPPRDREESGIWSPPPRTGVSVVRAAEARAAPRRGPAAGVRGAGPDVFSRGSPEDHRRFRYEKTSIFDMSSFPNQRHCRRLSHSQVGRAGNSPTFVVMHTYDRFGKPQCMAKLERMMQTGDVEALFDAWVDQKEFPLTNQEMTRTKNAIKTLLKKRVAEAKREGAGLVEFERVLEDAKEKMKILRLHLGMYRWLAKAERYATKLRQLGPTKVKYDTSATDYEDGPHPPSPAAVAADDWSTEEEADAAESWASRRAAPQATPRQGRGREEVQRRSLPPRRAQSRSTSSRSRASARARSIGVEEDEEAVPRQARSPSSSSRYKVSTRGHIIGEEEEVPRRAENRSVSSRSNASTRGHAIGREEHSRPIFYSRSMTSAEEEEGVPRRAQSRSISGRPKASPRGHATIYTKAEDIPRQAQSRSTSNRSKVSTRGHAVERMEDKVPRGVSGRSKASTQGLGEPLRNTSSRSKASTRGREEPFLSTSAEDSPRSTRSKASTRGHAVEEMKDKVPRGVSGRSKASTQGLGEPLRNTSSRSKASTRGREEPFLSTSAEDSPRSTSSRSKARARGQAIKEGYRYDDDDDDDFENLENWESATPRRPHSTSWDAL